MPLPKSAQLARGARRYRRKVASPKRWAQIIDAKQGPCRVCGGTSDISYHHLVPRSMGGSDTSSNIVPLCGDGTRGDHARVEQRDEAACRALVLSLTDDEYSYCVEKAGEGFFERKYGIRYERS
jgi:hypothetical protein